MVVIKGKTVLKAGTEVRKGKRRWEKRTAATWPKAFWSTYWIKEKVGSVAVRLFLW